MLLIYKLLFLLIYMLLLLFILPFFIFLLLNFHSLLLLALLDLVIRLSLYHILIIHFLSLLLLLNKKGFFIKLIFFINFLIILKIFKLNNWLLHKLIILSIFFGKGKIITCDLFPRSINNFLFWSAKFLLILKELLLSLI